MGCQLVEMAVKDTGFDQIGHVHNYLQNIINNSLSKTTPMMSLFLGQEESK